MEAVFILLTVFGSPVAILAVLRHYRLKEKQLQAGIDGQSQKLLLARCEELEARVQTLETIVCEGDLEAAAKIREAARSGELPASTRRALLGGKTD
jgi:hypothetical protein